MLFIIYISKLYLLIVIKSYLFREWKNPNPAPISKLREFFPRINDSYTSVNKEKIQEDEKVIHDRFDRTMKRIISRCNAKGIKSILIVTHAASKIAGVRAILQDRSVKVNCGTCSLTKLTLEDGKWKHKSNGDCSFLEDGEERNWKFPHQKQIIQQTEQQTEQSRFYYLITSVSQSFLSFLSFVTRYFAY